ncbi:uncharacterized protein LOC135213876 [Macrobrachium nipponense]|uniref:uncharacterized protein LOC135213876 n=1 Tax=Macrobrachium nipponense TaxID=159736 RepID=UPI0030C7A1C9
MKIMKWISLWLMVSDICISLLQIKKGAILKEHGHVKMIHDIAVVTINITAIDEQQQELNGLMGRIESLMSTNQNNSILLKLREDISQVLPKRIKKRSLLPFIGTALNTLFGVATDGDVDKDRARIEKLEMWAAERGTIMTKVIDATNKNQNLIVKLKDFVNNMAQNITTEINDLNKSQYVTKLLFETETFLLNHKELLNAVMLAAKNILSPYLISPSELHLVIEKCIEVTAKDILIMMDERRQQKGKNEDRYGALDRTIKRECTKAKEKWMDEICEGLDKRDERRKYDKVKEITFKKKRNISTGIKKKADGTIVMESKEILERWTEYDGELFDDDRVEYLDLNDNGEGPSMIRSEIEAS